MLDPYLIDVESVRTTHCCVHIVVFGNGRTEAGDTWSFFLVVRRQSIVEMVFWIAVSMPGCWLAVDPPPRIDKSMAQEIPVARRRRSANCMIFATEQSSRGCYTICHRGVVPSTSKAGDLPLYIMIVGSCLNRRIVLWHDTDHLWMFIRTLNKRCLFLSRSP